jgi:two-component system, NtrC family, sensor histidine kinase HydH
MKCDRYEILHKVVRIANRTFADFPRSSKSILRFLCRALPLQEAVFLQYSPRNRRFFRKISASGPELFRPCSSACTLEMEVLHSRHAQHRERAWFIPVTLGRQCLGILKFTPPLDDPLSEDNLKVLQIVAEKISTLLKYEQARGEEKRHLTRLTLLSHLGREMNQATRLNDLLLTSARTVLHQSAAAAVILRPLYGGALLGHSTAEIRDEFLSYRPQLLALEEEQSTRLLKGVGLPEPLFLHPGGKASGDAPPFPPNMAVVPLLFDNEPMGTLTLFGDGAQEDVLLIDDDDCRSFLSDIGVQIAHSLERIISRERLEGLSIENDRKLQETSLLYRISRAMHSTLRLNELIHLILSAAVVPGGGGFDRAMLFMINERTNTLQGMLCVTRETASLVIPPERGDEAWERPVVSDESQDAQRKDPWCRILLKQRLPLADENPLARAARLGEVVFSSHPRGESPAALALAEALEMGPYACAPLLGRERPYGVLVVDNPRTRENIGPSRRRFLELFANQAGGAMENSMLVHRLETAHQELRDAQDRLVQGEKMAILGEMAASVVHELRNPLIPIGGFADRLSRILPEGGRESEYATIIAREALRMEEMLTNILTFSKKQMLCFSECRMEVVLEEALALEAEAIGLASIRLKWEVFSSLPPVKCDEKKLRQVLINLLTNARQAMTRGGTLTVRAYRCFLRGEEAVAVEIEDTGGGISAEILHNIFNPFFTTKEKGTGLGLAISRRIIEQHGGEIEVRNREEGVVFTLRLPVSQEANLANQKIDKFSIF